MAVLQPTMRTKLVRVEFFSRVVCLKKIIIIAGPNGAGKTTFARGFLPSEAHTLRFINADLIAAGLAPFNSESVAFKAGRWYDTKAS